MCRICSEKNITCIGLLGEFDLICNSCHKVEFVNMFHYCWNCWDRMNKEDTNMINARAKTFREISGLFPYPYEMEYGKRVPKKFREKTNCKLIEKNK